MQRGTLYAMEPALAPATRRTVVLSVLGVHLTAAWALLQVKSVREAVVQSAPVFVSLLALPAPPQTAPVAPAPQPRQKAPLPAPPRSLVSAPAAPAPMPQAISVPPAAPDAGPPLPQAAPTVAEAPPAPTVSPAPTSPPVPAAPRAVPTTAVRYIVEPEPAYPTTSRRLGEAGEVRLRVEIGTDGRARHVSVHLSSGFPRLDESAIAAVRAARFAPYTEHGVALAVWTIVPIAFELQS